MDKEMKIAMAKSDMVDSSTIWLLFIFLGWSYGSMDQIGKQILFYLTFGGLGFWTLYRLFTLNKAINDFNRTVALKHNLSSREIILLGMKL